MKTTTETAFATFNDYCAEIGTTVEAEKNALLSIGRDLLPECARAVLDGGEPTADYWDWCLSQTEKAQQEHEAETASGHEWHDDKGAFVVCGVGETRFPLLRDASASEADWEAFYRSTSSGGRVIANNARNEGGWCVTVSKADITEEDLDNDPAVRAYCTEREAS